MWAPRKEYRGPDNLDHCQFNLWDSTKFCYVRGHRQFFRLPYFMVIVFYS